MTQNKSQAKLAARQLERKQASQSPAASMSSKASAKSSVAPAPTPTAIAPQDGMGFTMDGPHPSLKEQFPTIDDIRAEIARYRKLNREARANS